MRRFLRSVVSMAICLHATCSFAYELHTHAAITRQAYDRSVLADPTFLADMGLFSYSNALGLDYYDIKDGVARIRSVDSFEGDIIIRVGGDPLSFQGWLMRGAVREDDIPRFAKNPQDVPPPDEPFYRVFNHFYDPVYNRPLTVPAAFQSTVELLNGGAVHTALDWATGTIGTFGANIDRRNHFTLVDAREAMYRAATGRDSAGNVDIGPDNTPATEAVRNAYWATVFRSLGDVVHLVQDMGQPQHTRNDGHSPVNKLVQGSHIAVFEELTERRADDGGTFKCFDGNEASAIPPLVFSNYAVPTFSSYSEAFSTTPGGNVSQGRGLADYSNRGFFSAGTNLGNMEYALPSSNPADYSRQTVTDPNPCLPSGRQAEILRGAVPDLVGGSNTNVALTSRGLWDVPGYTIPREEARYSMNETVYYENADLLVTRAASYSAGIIDYFFRGKMDFVKDPQNSAQYIIRNLGSEEMEGTFALYYDDANGIRHPVPGASWQLILPPGQDSAPESFTAPTDPAPADSDYYLVFSGRMGNESPSTNSVGAVVVKRISEYWEPWGEALTENHGWIYFRVIDDVILLPPVTPIDGVLTLDTRVVTERGEAYCEGYSNCPEMILGIALCGYEPCSARAGVNANSRFMRIRLRADSHYAGNNASGDCGDMEYGLLGLEADGVGTPGYVFHTPNAENRIEFTSDGFRIYNNGALADYVIPMNAGETSGVFAFAYDRRGMGGGDGFPCRNAYFSLDIDYIDFIP